MLRQFDVGFEDPPLPEEPHVMNNNIRIGTMLGSIQQGTRDSNQCVNVHVDVPASLEFIMELEARLGAL